MKTRTSLRFVSLCFITILPTMTLASSFQIWEQDGASVGNYHAGYAALAQDASTAFYNPAGITRIKNQQVTFALNGIRTDFQYKGTVTVPTNFPSTLGPFQVNGGVFTVVPALHYVAPLNDKLGYGFSIDVPFGLKVNYGEQTFMRYAATMSELEVIDISPSLGYQLTELLSVGAGLDYQRVNAELDSVVGFAAPGVFDTQSTNKADGHGYGYHAGVLLQFSPETRLGMSYHSQVQHHLTGTSKFSGPLAAAVNGGNPLIDSENAYVNFTLPAYTALSAFHQFSPQLAVMGSIIYTQWYVFNELTLNNIAGVAPGNIPSTKETITMPLHYKNTYNLALGANYSITPAIVIKGGLGYDQSPVLNQYRDVRIPDNDHYVVAIGGHYQVTQHVGLDVGWSHFFLDKTNINPPPLPVGTEIIMTTGKVTGDADVFALQVTWDIV